VAIFPFVIHGIATYAGFVEHAFLKLLDRKVRRLAASLPSQRPRQRPIRSASAKRSPLRNS
jgi:hypothetical protein